MKDIGKQTFTMAWCVLSDLMYRRRRLESANRLAVSDASATCESAEDDRGGSPTPRGRLLRSRCELADEEEVGSVVVGLPKRLDGSPNLQTPRVEKIVAMLTAQLPIPVVVQDERLSSREAEERLALGEKDWRRRKEKLDAAAAAVILQDYLDARKR